MVARFGGDEFVAVLISLEEHSGAIPVIHCLLAVTHLSFMADDVETQISASIGITFYNPSSSEGPNQLLRYAD